MMMMVVIVILDTYNRKTDKNSTISSTIPMTSIFSMTITITKSYSDYERKHATQGLRQVYSACDFTIPNSKLCNDRVSTLSWGLPVDTDCFLLI